MSEQLLEQNFQTKIETLPGYPPRSFCLRLGDVALNSSGLFVPKGQWHVSDHINRRKAPHYLLDPEVPSKLYPEVPATEAQQWQAEGFLLDQYKRLIHPRWRELLACADTALPTGLGFFYRYGPNKTIDPVIYRQWNDRTPLQVLLIRRQKDAKWALPGRFIDRKDDIPAALWQGVQAKTGLDIPVISTQPVSSVHSFGRATTLHAWTHKQAVLAHAAQEYLYEVSPLADVDVGWFTVEEVAHLDLLPGHDIHIEASLQLLE